MFHLSDAPADRFGSSGANSVALPDPALASPALASPALTLDRPIATASTALANHVTYLTRAGRSATIRSAKLEDFLALGRFLAREACPHPPLTDRCRQLRQAAIATAAEALDREDYLYLVLERDGAVCAALPLQIAGHRLFAGRALIGQAALAFDPWIGLQLIGHVAQCCWLGGWRELSYLTECGDDGEAQALAAALRGLGLAAEVESANLSVFDRLRYGRRSHRIRIILAR